MDFNLEVLIGIAAILFAIGVIFYLSKISVKLIVVGALFFFIYKFIFLGNPMTYLYNIDKEDVTEIINSVTDIVQNTDEITSLKIDWQEVYAKTKSIISTTVSVLGEETINSTIENIQNNTDELSSIEEYLSNAEQELKKLGMDDGIIQDILSQIKEGYKPN